MWILLSSAFSLSDRCETTAMVIQSQRDRRQSLLRLEYLAITVCISAAAHLRVICDAGQAPEMPPWLPDTPPRSLCCIRACGQGNHQHQGGRPQSLRENVCRQRGEGAVRVPAWAVWVQSAT